jgi:hypothetical protein
MNRKDLQGLSRVRLSEGKALLGRGLPDGAYYLAGYAVECALKACIAKRTQRHDFPEKIVDASHAHNLKELVRIANLESLRHDAGRTDPKFDENWVIVQSWSEQSRYVRHPPASAQELVDAGADSNHGVMRWIKRYW